MAGFKQRKKLYGFYETGDVADLDKYKNTKGPKGFQYNPVTNKMEPIKPSAPATTPSGKAGTSAPMGTKKPNVSLPTGNVKDIAKSFVPKGNLFQQAKALAGGYAVPAAIATTAVPMMNQYTETLPYGDTPAGAIAYDAAVGVGGTAAAGVISGKGIMPWPALAAGGLINVGWGLYTDYFKSEDGNPTDPSIFPEGSVQRKAADLFNKAEADGSLVGDWDTGLADDVKLGMKTQTVAILADALAAGQSPSPVDVNDILSFQKVAYVQQSDNGLPSDPFTVANIVYGVLPFERGAYMDAHAQNLGGADYLLNKAKTDFQGQTGHTFVGTKRDAQGNLFYVGRDIENGDLNIFNPVVSELADGTKVDTFEFDGTYSYGADRQDNKDALSQGLKIANMNDATNRMALDQQYTENMLNRVQARQIADQTLAQRVKEFDASHAFDIVQHEDNLKLGRDTLTESQRRNAAVEAETIRQFDSTFKLDSAKFDEDKKQFGASFAENQRQYNLGLAEQQAQFEINDRRRLQQMQEEARVADSQIANQLNESRQQTAERMREILSNPADYLARAYAQRGEVSPFGEVTQADLYNQALGEYNQYAQYLDSLGRGFKANLDEEAARIDARRQSRAQNIAAATPTYRSTTPTPQIIPAQRPPPAQTQGPAKQNLPANQQQPVKPDQTGVKSAPKRPTDQTPEIIDDISAGQFNPATPVTPVTPVTPYPSVRLQPGEGTIPESGFIPPTDVGEEFIPGPGDINSPNRPPAPVIVGGQNVPEEFIPPVPSGGIRSRYPSYDPSFGGRGQTDISPANPNVQILDPATWGSGVPVGGQIDSGGFPAVVPPFTTLQDLPSYNNTFVNPNAPLAIMPSPSPSVVPPAVPPFTTLQDLPSYSNTFVNPNTQPAIMPLPSPAVVSPTTPPFTTLQNLPSYNQSFLGSDNFNTPAAAYGVMPAPATPAPATQAPAVVPPFTTLQDLPSYNQSFLGSPPQFGPGPYEHGGVAHGFGNPIVVGDSSKNEENQELVMSFGNAPMVVLPLNERQQAIMEQAGSVGPPRAKDGGFYDDVMDFQMNPDAVFDDRNDPTSFARFATDVRTGGTGAAFDPTGQRRYRMGTNPQQAVDSGPVSVPQSNVYSTADYDIGGQRRKPRSTISNAQAGFGGGNASFSSLAEMPSNISIGGANFGFNMGRPLTQQEIILNSERYSSPAVRDIFAGGSPAPMRFGFNLFTPGQMQSLTRDERDELRTRLAARNVSLGDVEQQVMRQFGATNTRRGRRTF